MTEVVLIGSLRADNMKSPLLNPLNIVSGQSITVIILSASIVKTVNFL